VVRRGRLKAVVVRAFLIGCVVLLVLVGCAGVRSEAPKEPAHTEVTNKEQPRSPEATASEQARCEGTRTTEMPESAPASATPTTTNDLPGCPEGGPLSGTDKPDKLAGKDGDDEIRGLGDKDFIYGGPGNDVIYGGPGETTHPWLARRAMTSSTGATVTMRWAQTVATTSSMAGMATMILIPTMMGGTSSIAVLAGTNTLLTRTTMWIAVARRIPAPGPSHRGTRGTTI